MMVLCGQCRGMVDVPDVGRRVGLCACGCAVAPIGTPRHELEAAMREMGLRPASLYPDTRPNFTNFTTAPPLHPEQVSRDSAGAFGRQAEYATSSEFYASWSAYDAALQGMSPGQQDLQRKAEILALHQMAAL